jgi:predicted permease
MVGAVLLARTYMGLASRPLGFKTDRALGAVLLLPSNRYANAEHTTPLFERLLIDVRALPGVESAALTSAIPLSGMNARRPYSLTGSPDTISTQDDRADFHVVTPAYFDVMGIPLRRGRVFDDRDRAEAPEVVVVNDVLARRLWPNADPVGQTIMVPDQFSPARRQVVGVVGSTRHSGPASEPTPEIYRPAYQTYWPFWGLIVRTATDPSSAHLPLTRAIWAVDKDISILSVRNLTELAAESYGPRRASFVLLAALAMLAVILTVFGIYGVIAYTVAQRAKEIGIRIALGATPARVVMSLVRQSAPWTLLGVTAGLLLALALTRFLRTLLFEVSPIDLPAFVTGAALLLLAALAATVVPARSASKMDPVATLARES